MENYYSCSCNIEHRNATVDFITKGISNGLTIFSHAFNGHYRHHNVKELECH